MARINIKKTSPRIKKPATKKAAVKKPSPAKTKTKPIAKTATKLVTAKAATKAASGVPEMMRDAALTVLNDKKGDDIVSITLIGRSSIADYLLIASGTNARQVAAMAGYLRDAFYKAGAKKVRVEGLTEANWVLVDAGDVIVHLFRPEVRKYYDLDAIWNGRSRG